MSAVRSKSEDLKIGASNEVSMKSKIEKYFKVQISKTEDPFFPFDFSNPDNTFYAETKRRLIHSHQYPTAIIGEHKVKFCTDPNKTYVFVWNYNDGIYYIKYDKNKFDKYEKRLYKRYDRADHSQMEAPHYFIPISDLKKME